MSTPPSSGAPAPPSRQYSSYVLLLLTLVFVMNLADRQVIAIVAEPLKRELHLADWQLGMLTGPATALLYAALALPMAYVSDRVNRAKFIAIVCGMWSVVTALGGIAQNVWQLALSRLGVSIAESGGSPASISLLSDYFSAKHRATALAVWSSAVSLGVFVGFALGGIANDMVGWRGAFFVAGIPGVILAVIIWFTLRERQRGSADAFPPPPAGAAKSPIWHDMSGLLRIRVLRANTIAASVANIGVYAIYSWGPSAALRNFDVTTSQVGTTVGIGIAIAGLGFSLFAGAMVDFLSRRNPSYPMIMTAVMQIAAAVLFAKAMLAPTFAEFSLYLPLTFGVLMTFGPLNLFVHQTYAPPWRRGMAAALNSLAMSLIGPGVGVPVIGALSDWLAPSLGAASLRTAMLCVVPAAMVLAAICFLGVAHAAARDRPFAAGDTTPQPA